MRGARETEEDKNVKVDTKFGLFREHEIDEKLKEAEKEGPPAVGPDKELVDTSLTVEKIEATDGSHAIRWLEQEGQQRTFVQELVYAPESGNTFLRTVFLIVLAMLFVTVAINIGILYLYNRKSVFDKYRLSALFISALCFMAVNYFWACSAWARIKPHNIIGLFLGVPAMSSVVAAVSACLKIHYSCLMVLGGIIVGVFVCSFLSLTKLDFRTNFLYIIVSGSAIAAVVVTLLQFNLLFQFIKVDFTITFIHLCVLPLTTAIALLLLVMELHLMLSGKYIEVLEDDQALAAWLLYASSLTFILKLVQTFDLVDTD